MNCYVIDDERHNIDDLVDRIEKTEGLTVAGFNTDPIQALVDIETMEGIDVVFTDINMPKLSGIDVVLRLPKHIKPVLVTANLRAEDLAIELKAELLYKPVQLYRFKELVIRLKK